MLAGVKINARCSSVLFARLAMCTWEECVRMRARYKNVVNNVKFLPSRKYIFKFSELVRNYCDAIRILFVYLFVYFISIVYVCKLSLASPWR